MKAQNCVPNRDVNGTHNMKNIHTPGGHVDVKYTCCLQIQPAPLFMHYFYSLPIHRACKYEIHMPILKVHLSQAISSQPVGGILIEIQKFRILGILTINIGQDVDKTQNLQDSGRQQVNGVLHIICFLLAAQ